MSAPRRYGAGVRPLRFESASTTGDRDWHTSLRAYAMEQDFWLERWDTDRTAFHQSDFNPHLLRHWPSLGVSDARVLVPLCGKSRDMLWLRDAGHHVIGVEWSEKAVEAFFSENGLNPRRTTEGDHVRFEAPGIEVWCGDFMTLTPAMLGQVGAVFDRASLVALPPELRTPYADALSRLLSPGSQGIAILLEYPEGARQGPPFSVSATDLTELYEGRFKVSVLDRTAGTLGEDQPVTTTVYALERLG